VIRRLLPVVLLASTTACATILDFQEPTDLATTPDAEAPSSTTSTINATSPVASSPASPASPAAALPPDAAVEAGPHDAGSGAGDAEPTPSPKPSANECTCVASAPAGWRGPYVIAEQAGAAPDCVGDYPITAYSGQSEASAEAAECACSCGEPTNVACSAPATSLHTDPTCAEPACDVDSSPRTCGDALLCGGGNQKVVAVSFGPSLPSGGSCKPSVTAHVPPVSSAGRSIRLCAPLAAGADCEGGACQPKPSPVFATNNRCVVQDGDIAVCPAAFPNRRVYYSGGSDTRACSQCQCDAPVGTTCTATASTCKDPTTVDAPSGCLAVSAGTKVITAPGTPHGGACAPSGGQPIGAFDPGRPTTACCLD
jgi:hypothetical protein